MTPEVAAGKPARKPRTMRPKPQRPLVGREPLAEPAEVATYLKSTEKTLEDWRYRETGPRYVRVGNNVRYHWSDVDDWVERNTIETRVKVAA